MNALLRIGLPLFVASLCIASLAHAQDAAPETPSPYELAITDALLEFQAQRFPEARALFERAHAIYPNARTLRGIGMSAFEMRDYPHAWASLRAALAHTERPLTEAQRADVTTLLERTQLFLARVELEGVPETARVLVDGREPVRDSVIVLVSPGQHTISVDAEGMRAFSQSIDAVGGVSQHITVSLEPDIGGAPIAAPAPAAAPIPVERSPAPWILVGGGGGTVVLGLTIGSIGLAHARDESRDAGGARRLGYTGDVLMGLGVATAVGGLVWGLVARRAEAPSVVVTGVVSEDRAALLVGGRF